MNKHHPGERPCQGGGGDPISPVWILKRLASVFINACRLLSALPSLSRFHSTRCHYFLGHVACQTLPWLGLRRVFFIPFLEKAGIDWCITVPYITLVVFYRWWPEANKLKFIKKTGKFLSNQIYCSHCSDISMAECSRNRLLKQILLKFTFQMTE